MRFLFHKRYCWVWAVIGLPLASLADTNNVSTNDTSTNAFGGYPTQFPAANARTIWNSADGSTNQTIGQSTLPYQYGVAPTFSTQAGPSSVSSPFLTSPTFGTSAINTPFGLAGASTVPGNTAGIPLWGPIDVHPHAAYSSTYATSLEVGPGTQRNTFVNTIYAGFLFDLGSHWRLDYSPYYTIYSEKGFQNTLGHQVALTGGTTYKDWTFGLSQTFARTDEPLVETGQQTAQDNYNTSLTAAWQMSSKVSTQYGLSQTIRDASQFESLTTWSGNSGINYQLIPQFGIGAQLSGGYNSVSSGSDMPFEELQGTLNFRPGNKFSLTLSGGAEELQFVNPSAKPLLTPTFSASVNYLLFPGTALSLVGSRTVNPSYFANEVQVSTRISANIQQKLSKKVSLGLSAGYGSTPLTSIVPAPLPKYFIGIPPMTEDSETINTTTTTIGLSLSYAATEKLSASVSWSENQSTSSQANYQFSSTQFGFSLSYRY